MNSFYDSAKPLIKGHLLNMAEVEQVEEIERREALVESNMAATTALMDFLHNFERVYAEELLRKGVPTSSVAVYQHILRTNMTIANPRLDKLWTARLEWGTSELAALDLLKTNWDSWVYDEDAKKVVFEDKSQVAEYNRLVGEIDRALHKMQALQQQVPSVQ